ncbi:uncharacterized protein [Rutidosis leptorrhynchoides]|uniref:uncharacterized protein isoform X2 n=1 Tax=Rutidosis leptorrhynchoides TaxID=125765 RepID=UPI003A999F6A
MRTKQTARGSGNKLDVQLMDARNKLINVSSSSTPDILNVLLEMENVLCKVRQPSKMMIKELNPTIQALIDKGLLKHPDMNVNISVVCCICDIIRLMPPDAPPYDHQHMKEFFEALVTSLEKQSGGYCDKMTRVLQIFSKSRLPVIMLDVQVDELVGRLFKHFLTIADLLSFNNEHKMEKIMTTIIEGSDEALALEALITTTLEKIASPICWRLGQRVLKNCAAKLRPICPDMAQDEAKGTTNPCTSDTSMLRNDTTHNIKSDDEKNVVSINDPSTTSNCAIEVNGKRKRNDEQVDIQRNKQTARGRGSGNKLDVQLMDVRNKLINVSSSSTPDILNVLLEMENVLRMVQQPSKMMIKELNPTIQALIDKGLVRHPDMNVNISVVCCICDIIRLMPRDAPPYDHQHMKEFFEALVTSFEKQSEGGYCDKMTRVLNLFSFSKSRLPVIMLDVQVEEELVGRLFKHFLTFADSNNEHKMEKIMTMIMEGSGEALALEALITATIEKVNKIASPICWRLGQRVLKNCAAAKLRQIRPDMAQDEAKGTNPCTSDTSKLRNDTTHNIKSDDEKNVVSINDPSTTSNCVTEVNGKRKRDGEQQREPKKFLCSMIFCGYKITKSNAPILEAIFKKHGDITSDCLVKAASVRESILEGICEVVKRIQTDDFKTIISDMDKIEMQVLDAEATNMNVAWLRTHLEALHKKIAVHKQSALLVNMKANTSLVKKAAKLDLEERRIELVTAQEQYRKAERCVQVLDLVETKLNDKFLESEAEKDSWLKDSVL